jgi:hypothetical protein
MASTLQIPVERAQRFPLHVSLRYRKNGVSHWLDGKTINISRTGILFQADDNLPIKSVLDILVYFPMKVTLTCRGLVVRAEESACAVHLHRFRLTHPQQANHESHKI